MAGSDPVCGETGEEESFREEFRSRLIAVHDMEGSLRVLTGLVAAVFLLYVAMIWRQRLFGGEFVDAHANGEQIEVTRSALVLGGVLFSAAWALTLSAVSSSAVRSEPKIARRHDRLRAAVLGLYTMYAAAQFVDLAPVARGLIVFLVPFFSGVVVPRSRPRLIGAMWSATLWVYVVFATVAIVWEARLRVFEFALVAPIWLLSRRGFLRVRAQQGFRLSFALVMFGLVVGFLAVNWLVVGTETAASRLIAWVAWAAFLALGPVLLLAGTEIVEIAFLCSEAASRRLKPYSTLLATAALAGLDVALAIAQFSWRVIGIELAGVGLVVAFGVLLFRTNALSVRDSTPISSGFLGSLAVALGVVLGLLVDFNQPDVVLMSDLGVLASVYVGIAALGVGGDGTSDARARIRFGVLAGLSLVAVATVTAVLAHFEVPLNFAGVVWGFAAAIGLGTLIIVGWLMLARRVPPNREDAGRVARHLLALNLGCSLIALVAVVLSRASGSGERLSDWQALFVVIVLAWELVTSGDRTNKDGDLLARHSRLLLFLGYVLAVAAAALLLAESRLSGLPSAFPPPFDSELVTRFGLLILGFPLLLYLVLPRIASAVVHVPRRQQTRSRTGGSKQLGRGLLPDQIAVLGLIVVGLGTPFALIAASMRLSGGRAPQAWKLAVGRDGDFAISYPPGWRSIQPSGNHLMDAVGPLPSTRPRRWPELYVVRLPESRGRVLRADDTCPGALSGQPVVSRPAGRAYTTRCMLEPSGSGAARSFAREFVVAKAGGFYAIMVLTWHPDSSSANAAETMARSLEFI